MLLLQVMMLITFILSLCAVNGYLAPNAKQNAVVNVLANNKSDCTICHCVGLTADCGSRNLSFIPMDLPKDITTLILSSNHIKDLPDYELGKKYGKLKVLDIRNNKISIFRQHVFSGLDHLQDLKMGGNPFKPRKFHPLVFKPLKKIRNIHVSGYGDESNGKPESKTALLNAFEGLQNSTIESITYHHITYMPFLLETNKYFKFLPSLKRFVFTDNRVFALESGFSKYMPNLEILDLSKNCIQGSIPDRGILIELYFMRSLRVVKVEHNNPGYTVDTTKPVIPISKYWSETELPIPNALEELYLKGAIVDTAPGQLPYGVRFQQNNKIRILDISDSIFFTYIGKAIKGLVKLEKLLLRKNYCIIKPEIFTCVTGYFESLEVLDLANNKAKLSSNSSEHILFKNCSQLRHLDVSYNELSDIDKDVFVDTTGLKVLDLCGNKIKHITIILSELQSLQLLNLSNNKIQTLENHIRLEIEQLTKAESKNSTIDIRNNPLICNCGSFGFINWMQAHHHIFHGWTELTCLYINGSEVLIKDIMIPLIKWDCWRDIIIPAIVSFGFAVLGAVTALNVYRRRYKIHYLILHLRALLRRNQYDNTSFDFDGFISYSSLDKDWSLTKIYAPLAAKYNYNICLDDRNFMPGAYIADIIIESISKSNKIILIISQNFLRSGWCTFEMNLARGELATRGRDCLILILKEPIDVLPPELITPTLRSLLETRVYLEWSENEDRKLLFWRKMKDALGDPRYQGEEDTQYLCQVNQGDEEVLQQLIE